MSTTSSDRRSSSRAVTSRASASRSTSDPEGRSLTLVEYVDIEAGRSLLRSSKMLALRKEDQVTWRSISHSIGVAIQLGGRMPVRYYLQPGSEWGRFRAEVMVDGATAVPFVHMKREIRAHLAASAYYDVDLVNAHPSILLQLLCRYNIKAPLLAKYVNDRASCLAEVMEAVGADRDTVKNLFVRLLFFGGIPSWQTDNPSVDASKLPAWVREFKAELADNAKILLGLRDFRDLVEHVAKRKPKDGHSGGAVATAMAILLQTKEREIIETLVEAVQDDGRVVGSIIYDGIHVQKMPGEERIAEDRLAAWLDYVVKRTRFDVQLAVKEFDRNPDWLGSHIDGDGDDRPPPVDADGIMTYSQTKKAFERYTCKILKPIRYLMLSREGYYPYAPAKLVEAYGNLVYCVVTRGGDGDSKHDDDDGYDCSGSDGDGSSQAAEACDLKAAVKRKPFLKRWLMDPTMRTYEYSNLLPPPLVCPEDTFNTWLGFDAAKYKPVKPIDTDSAAVRAFVQHWRTLLGDDEASLAYVLDWIAQIVQEPAVKPGIALLLKGKEGSGKNRATDLLKMMLGPDKYLETARPCDVLYGKFTQPREGRFLIVINEASGRDNYAANDILKDMITSEEFISEGKNTNSYKHNCYARFIFTTNNDNSVKVSPDSRRFVVFEVSSSLKGNSAYFTTLSAHMKDPHARREFFDFLKARDLTARDWTNDRPVTAYYREMVEASLDFDEEFMKIKVLEWAAAGERVHEESFTAFFTAFKLWVADRAPPTYRVNESAFGKALKKMVRGEPEGFEGLTKIRRSGWFFYLWDVTSFATAMVARKWVAEESVEFGMAGDAFVDDEAPEQHVPGRPLRE